MIQTQITPDRLAELTLLASSTEHVFLVMNTPNKNGRTYPTNVVVDALSKLQYPLLGCFMGDIQGTSVNLAMVSHQVLSTRIDGDNVYARIAILKTPMGKALEQMDADYRTSGMCLVDPVTGIVSGLQIITVAALPKGTGA